MSKFVLILGASVRAAAASARRAGWEAICGDLFADRDLEIFAAAVHRVDSIPALVRVADLHPNIPCLFAGGMENLDTASLQRIAINRPGWMPAVAAITRSRDPGFVSRMVRRAGLPTAAILPSDATPFEGDWLWKPLHGSSGFHIRRMDASRKLAQAEASPLTSSMTSRGYLQAFIPGTPASAVCLGFANPFGGTRAMVLGTCRQELSGQRVPSRPFGFAGAITPYPGRLDTQCLHRLAETVAAECELTGLFGIDFVVDESTGEATLIEVNPRYTATVELIERRLQCPLLQWHVAAIQTSATPDAAVLRREIERAVNAAAIRDSTSGAVRFFAKRIVYAESPRRIRDPWVFDTAIREAMSLKSGAVWNLPCIADLPQMGAEFDAGDPICTLFVEGNSGEETAASLDRGEQFIRQAMKETSP